MENNGSRTHSSWKKMALSIILIFTLLPVWTVSAASSDLVKEVLDLLVETHVSGTTEEALSQAAIEAIIQSLNDPYTEYFTEESLEAFIRGISPSFVGIGVQLDTNEEGNYIVQVFPGSPAEEAGLLPNDILVRVDNTLVSDKSLDEIVGLVRGQENTNVLITVRRDGEIVTKAMIRRAISLPVVESVYQDGIGYISLYSFTDESDEQFTAHLEAIKARDDLRSIVIDLRDNPGGLVESTVHIAAQFIQEGVLIQTRANYGADDPVTIANGSSVDVPVFVLVNEHSASASEVLAGALQDYGVAVIIGGQTTGKGSVQTLYQLSDGSVIKVTIQEYYTPNGHAVNQVGITPDVEVEGRTQQLLVAFGLAGAPYLLVEKENAVVTVNGVATGEPLPVIEEEGRVWAHSRLLAAMLGAEVEWIQDSQGVRLTVDEGQLVTGVFSPGSGDAMMVNDRAFIDVAAFAAVFSQFDVSGGIDDLVLKAVRGN